MDNYVPHITKKEINGTVYIVESVPKEIIEKRIHEQLKKIVKDNVKIKSS